MPFVHIVTEDVWSPGPQFDGGTTIMIGQRLTEAVASAVNETDQLTPGSMLDPSMVRVDFSQASPHTINGSEMEILINPGLGAASAFSGPGPTPIEAGMRRRAILDRVEAFLQDLFADHNNLAWPEYTIEIVPTPVTGHLSGSTGVIRRW